LRGSSQKGTKGQAPLSSSAGPGPKPRSEGLLFALAIACSAFLIFLVQPMVGKRLLPWYGGAPGVWALCLAFYQTTLFVGYAYAHLLIRLHRPRLELGIHGLLFVAALLALPVLPGDVFRPETSSNATAEILVALVSSVALPFLFLAATGPLVQTWFARAHAMRTPYFLYALSNAGSLLALFIYPFFLEPNLGLSATGSAWSFGFTAIGVAVLACGAVAIARSPAPTEAAPLRSEPPPRTRILDALLWMTLAGVAVVLLMGITNQLCLDIASVPFLWVLPLSVYLLTFILCFASERFYRRGPMLIIIAITMLLLPLSEPAFNQGTTPNAFQSLPVAIGLYLLLLFASCMVLHGELYRRRPGVEALTSYYLWISAGGALGGVFVGIAAERWFLDYYEVPLGFAAFWVIALGLAMRDSKGTLGSSSPRWRRVAASGLAFFLVVSMLSNERFRTAQVVHQERSFFGVLRVIASQPGKAPAHVLRHGTTLHGMQFTSPSLRTLPTAYYGFATGIGLALQGATPGTPVRVGVVGLGSGTLAAYGRPGDLYRFYEIDPAVTSLASRSEFFTFLSDTKAEIDIVEADGRLALEEEQRRGEPKWDVLVIDAFSSDAVPVHLLTREALALYERRLAQGGVIAIHASNRNLTLIDLCFRLARASGLSAAALRTASAPGLTSVPARWVFLTREPERLEGLLSSAAAASRTLGLPRNHVAVARLDRASATSEDSIWTDDYSDLLGILRRPQTRR
jgi:spermidine synthase